MHLIFLPTVIVLIGLLVGGFAFAAARGCTMPLAVCLILIIAGAVMILAPLAGAFLLQLFGRAPLRISEDERITLSVIGGLMVFIGVVGSLFSRRSDSGKGMNK
jgi:hypothetical protein